MRKAKKIVDKLKMEVSQESDPRETEKLREQQSEIICCIIEQTEKCTDIVKVLSLE